MQQNHLVSKTLFLFTILLFCGAGIFSSCSTDDNPASEPDTTPITWHDGVMQGYFSINANGQQVQFSQGNLQYRAATHTWRFAQHQYDVVGDATTGNVYENGVKSLAVRNG